MTGLEFIRGPDKQHSDDQLLAELTAILSSPSASFLRKYDESQKYWSESGKVPYVCSHGQSLIETGQWKGEVKTPNTTLEDTEVYLKGESHALFLQFMREMLQWDPDERLRTVDGPMA